MKTRKYVRGFTLLEVSLAIAISMMALTWALWSKVNELRQEKARVQGDSLVTLSNSVGTYLTNNYNFLVKNAPIAGYANIYAPTIPELIAGGLLTNNFSKDNFYGSAYAIKVSTVPAGCIAPNCDIESLVYLTGPAKDYRNNLIDGPTLGAAATRIGSNGGFSDATTPGTIKGIGSGWSVPNPVGVAGILAVRGGYGSSGWAQFLRRDGTLPMTGSLNMDTNDINAAKTVNSESIHNAKSIETETLASTAAVNVGGTLQVVGISSTNGITNNGAISTATLGTTGQASIGGALNVTGLTTLNTVVNNGKLTNNGEITATGDISGARFLPTTIVAPGDACIGLDGYQARTSAGSLASCVNGKWMTPDTAVKPVPCVAQSVTWGAGCGASIGPTASGDTTIISFPSTPSGATGSATYFCSGGVQVLQPGSSCTLAPCTTQTLSWGGGCSATFPSTPVGTSKTQSATTGIGTGTATCNAPGGNGGWSSPTGSCTPPPAPCSAGQYVPWSQYQSAWQSNAGTAGTYSCYGYSPSGAHGSSAYISTANSGTRNGGATAICNNGTWSVSSSSCDGNLRGITTNFHSPQTGVDNTIIACYVSRLFRYPSSSEKAWNSYMNPPDCSFIDISTERGCVNGAGGWHICPSAESDACGSSGYAYPWTGATKGSCKSLPG